MPVALDLMSRPLVLFGPSGTGKSTLLKRLFAEFPNKFGFSVSHTTRNPRAGELDGVAYNFVSRDSFLKSIEEGAFIEYATFSGNMYGTTFRAVKDVSDHGKRCILDIDAQGVRTLKAHPTEDINATYLFIAPPSLSTLRHRLTSRNTESEDHIKARLETALAEIEYVRDPNTKLDAVIVNDELDRAYAKLRDVALGKSVESDALPRFDD